MYTLAQLQDDIATVVGYNWSDEVRDYQTQIDEGNEEGAEHHIIHVLRRLESFASPCISTDEADSTEATATHINITLTREEAEGLLHHASNPWPAGTSRATAAQSDVVRFHRDQWYRCTVGADAASSQVENLPPYRTGP